MMRIQHWVLVPYGGSFPLETPDYRPIDICQHMFTYGKTVFPQEFDYMIACRRSHFMSPDEHCIMCSGLRKCDQACESVIIAGRNSRSITKLYPPRRAQMVSWDGEMGVCLHLSSVCGRIWVMG